MNWSLNTDSRISTPRSSLRQIFTTDPPDTTASRESAIFGNCGGHYVAGCDLDHEPGIHVAVACISIGVAENARAMARWCIRWAMRKTNTHKVKSRSFLYVVFFLSIYRKRITHRNTRSTKTLQNAINTETTRDHYSAIITQRLYLNWILPGTYL
jgi:hypothetical protein